MLRTRSLLICLTAVTFCLVGIALGKANKVDLVATDDSDASGFAILNYTEGADKTNVNVQGRNLESGAVYTVLLCDRKSLECEPIGTLTAKTNGKAHLKVSCPGDVSEMCVAVADGDLPSGAVYLLTNMNGVTVRIKIAVNVVIDDFKFLERKK